MSDHAERQPVQDTARTTPHITIHTVDAQTLQSALAYLTTCDADLARSVDTWGPPPLWARQPGFATLIHIILEQQVSLASAKAAFDRLVAATKMLTPATFLALDDTTLRQIGFSRQKRDYGRGIAQAILADTLDLDAFPALPDATVRQALLAQKGIGAWTADIYLLMALGRADIWPAGDLALAVAAQSLKRMAQRPDPAELTHIAASWRPWRAVAARILWHEYLNRQTRR
ncbi:MAG: hypothetical protein WDZ49_14970 [Litorilinea sp.]